MSETEDGVVLQAAGPEEGLVLSALQSAAYLLAEIGPAPVEVVVQSGAVGGLVADHSSTAVAYLLPMGCFVIVAAYARGALKAKPAR